MDLSQRQCLLLRSIIEEFIDSAEPVGSKVLVEKYSLKVSPATVRNEMGRVLDQGFLEMDHVSSGRRPTVLGLRYYIRELLEPDELPVLQEVALKQRIGEDRFELDKFLRNAAAALAEVTGLVSFVTTEDGRVFSAGAFRLLDHPEFYDIDVTRAVLHLLDDGSKLNDLLARVRTDEPVRVVFGPELELPNLSPVGVTFANFQSGSKSGYVGVLGPARMDYSQAIPAVGYLSRLMGEAQGNW